MPYGWFQAYKEAHPQLLKACGKRGSSKEHKRVLRLYGQALKMYAEQQRGALMVPAKPQTANSAAPENSAVVEDKACEGAAELVPADEHPFAKNC